MTRLEWPQGTEQRDSRHLQTRIVILEAALASIDRECEWALANPAIVFMTMCRVAALSRQALTQERLGN